MSGTLAVAILVWFVISAIMGAFKIHALNATMPIGGPYSEDAVAFVLLLFLASGLAGIAKLPRRP